MRGMFMDGMLYAVVAHNLAHGIGTFWEPIFSRFGFAGLDHFHEHPPLGFGLESLWFRAFGDGFWVEHLYCLMLMAVTAYAMLATWRLVLPRAVADATSWWPLLLWLLVPQVAWATVNNMLEVTMGAFTAIAVFLSLGPGGGLRPLRTALAGLAVLLATLTKGVPGAFPIAAPLIWALVSGRVRPAHGMIRMTIMIVVVLLGYGILLAWPDARANLATYVNTRLLHRIADQHTVAHRWRILSDLFLSQSGPLALATLVWFMGRGGRSVPNSGRAALALLLIGLSGVLPLMLTLVQKSFYSVPAFPFIALGLGLWSFQGVQRALARTRGRTRLVRVIGTTGSITVVGAVLVAIALWGRPLRDADILADVERIGRTVPQGAFVGIDPVLWERWNLQGYLLRDHFISMDPNNARHAWFLGPVGAPPPDGAQPVDLGLSTVRLFERTEGMAPIEGMK